MFDDHMFLVALQSSLMLGLIHGVNPCGHSWLVLAPFVAGEKSGARVAWLTIAFTGGTAAACVLLGFTLGAVSELMPVFLRSGMDYVTDVILVVLGAVLIVKPGLLHSHDHDHHHDHHDHDHDHHDHDHDHDHHGHGHAAGGLLGSVSAAGLFSLGFVNMIVPCPTVAIMFGYAVDSGDALKSASVFTIYALSTAVALASVIFAIYKVQSLVRKLEQEWIETAIMRAAGVLTAGFGIYGFIAGH